MQEHSSDYPGEANRVSFQMFLPTGLLHMNISDGDIINGMKKLIFGPVYSSPQYRLRIVSGSRL